MTNTTEDMQMLSFNIILHAGNARSSAMEAIMLAKDNKIAKAHEKIEEANEAFTNAHHEQTKLLQDEANGLQNDVSVILVHAQDHLMTTMTVKDLATEMIEMYAKINRLEDQ